MKNTMKKSKTPLKKAKTVAVKLSRSLFRHKKHRKAAKKVRLAVSKKTQKQPSKTVDTAPVSDKIVVPQVSFEEIQNDGLKRRADIEEKIHWICNYLVGLYPGKYRTPNIFLFIDSLQDIDCHYFADDRLKLMSVDSHGSTGFAFYHTCISAVERMGADKFKALLDMLEIPEEVRGGDPHKDKQIEDVIAPQLPDGKQYSPYKLGLYLGGSFPPYYIVEYPRLELLKIVEYIIPDVAKSQSWGDFKTIIDANCFYKELASWVHKHCPAAYGILLEKLKIPEDVRYV